MAKKITSGTKEWATYNVNCMNGCFHNCRYCYAKIMAVRFGRHTNRTWRNMKVNTSSVNKKYQKRNGRIMFPSSHDICDFLQVKKACFAVLAKLLKTGNKVLITTKPRLTITKQIIREFEEYKNQIQFRFTITSMDNSLLSFWEPNAPGYRERINSLKYAYSKKFKTSVSIEPFLDNDPTTLVQKVSPFVTESIWVGKMNYIPDNHIPGKHRNIYSAIRNNYAVDHLWEIYEKLKRYPKVRFKDSIRIKLGINGN